MCSGETRLCVSCLQVLSSKLKWTLIACCIELNFILVSSGPQGAHVEIF